MTTTRDGLTALRAAKKAFELAGNRHLAVCAETWISEVEDEIRSEERQAQAEARIRGIALKDGGIH